MPAGTLAAACGAPRGALPALNRHLLAACITLFRWLFPIVLFCRPGTRPRRGRTTSGRPAAGRRSRWAPLLSSARQALHLPASMQASNLVPPALRVLWPSTFTCSCFRCCSHPGCRFCRHRLGGLYAHFLLQRLSHEVFSPAKSYPAGCRHSRLWLGGLDALRLCLPNASSLKIPTVAGR